MKKAQVKRGFFLLAILVLAMSPFVFAGFSEWWAEFTGRATYNDTDVSVTLGNTGPTIPFVYQITGAQPTEGYGYDYYVWFNASDVDGAGNIDDTTAQIRLNTTGQNRDNNSCILAQTYTGDNTKLFNCTVHLEYWDAGGTWTINASVQDINSAGAQNLSLTFTHGTLHAINITPTTQSWGSISTSDTNTTSDEGFMNITNTGNAEPINISVGATNLRGVDVTSEFIFAENFSVGHEAGAEAGCNGTQLQNATTVQIEGAQLNKGQMYTGVEQIFFCITALDGGLSAQTYNSTHYGPWNVSTQY